MVADTPALAAGGDDEEGGIAGLSLEDISCEPRGADSGFWLRGSNSCMVDMVVIACSTLVDIDMP